MTTRRHVLQVLAGASAGAAAGCSESNLQDPTEGWRDPGAGEKDPRRIALAHAILAPNPHNMQPWLVELNGEDEMTLYCDLERLLPATDPYDRQITLGCGAFLYLYQVALLLHGFESTMELFPDGAPDAPGKLDQRALGRVRMSGPAPVELLETFVPNITERRTNRLVYDTTSPPITALDSVAAAALNWVSETTFKVGHTSEDPQRTRIRDVAWRAWEKELHTPHAWEESVNVMRIGKQEIAEHRDGLVIDGPNIGLAKMFGMLSRKNMLDPNSSANQEGQKQWRAMIESAPTFMWLTSPDDAPVTRLRTGMAYVRMNLSATRQGLAMHPWSQALQEYPEMAPLYQEMRDVLEIPEGETLQMLVRVGNAATPPPAPRRALADFIKASA